MNSAGTRLGVDLGTTWTAAALRHDGRVEVVELGTDTPAMPSVVATASGDGGSGRRGKRGKRGELGEIIAGERAERQLLVDPASGVRECKRRLGDTAPMVMAGEPYGAEALMGHLLRHTVQVATATADGPPDEVVLTHPAVWGDYKLDLVREAGRQAGVGEVTLMAEPVAAALHYVSLGRIGPGDVVAVYDFGGGTFDAAVVRCTESGAEILGRPEGLERLGGVDLDQIVVLHVDQALGGRLRELDTTDPEGRRALVRLRADCTAAKEALSNDTEVNIPVALPGLHTEVRLTRDELEAAARSRIADTLGALDRAIADAGIAPPALAGVLLVGGSSRIPVVAEEVGRRTGRPTLLDADPKLVVALGAAGGSTVMSPNKNNEPIDPAEGTSGTAAAPPPPPPPRPAAPPSASAQAGARAAALRAAASTGTKPKGSGRGAAVGAAAAAAGVAAAGYAAYELLGDDGNDSDGKGDGDEAPEDQLAAPPDESLDAFDDLGAGAAARLAAGGVASVARLRGGGGDDGVVVRERVRTVERPVGRGDTSGDDTPLADIGDARAELLERFAAWEPPADADPGDVAAFRTEMEGLINRYQPHPGQSANDALAELRLQFDDQVEDFVQDLKLDAVVDHQGGTPPPIPVPIPTPQAPHWEWDEQQGRWEWDEGGGVVPVPPPVRVETRPGFEWVPGHAEGGQTVPGHWERPLLDGSHVDRPGLDWVEDHVDAYGRTVPAHWQTEPAQPAPPYVPPPPDGPINVPLPETYHERTWAEGHYDQDGCYVRGHWEDTVQTPGGPTPPVPGSDDPDAPPPIIINPTPMPPTPVPMPPTPPPPPPVPPTAPPTGPYQPPPVGSTWEPNPGPPPIVREHAGNSGGVVVTPSGGPRGQGEVRDHRANAAPSAQEIADERVREMLDQMTNPAGGPGGGDVLRPPMALRVASADPADDLAPAAPPDAAADGASAAGTAPADPAAEPPAGDLLGVEAFANASADAPVLDLVAQLPPPTPAPPDPAPAAEATPVTVPEPVAAPAPEPEPVMAVVDPIPADPPSDFADQDDLGQPDSGGPADDDEAPSDLDTNPHTPL